MNSLNTKEIEVIGLRAQGETQQAIEAITGISQPTISRLTSKHKDIIAATSAKYVEDTLPTILERTTKEIKYANTIDVAAKDNQAFLTRVDKKEETILKGVGIAPSHAPSIHIQQIFNDNSKTVLSPIVADMLQGKLSELTQPVIDAEIVDKIK